MTAYVIGRAQALAAPTEWGGRTWDQDGDRVRFEGHIWSTDSAAARVLRQQLLGHEGEVVPVTSVDDPTVDGFYRVLSSKVGSSARSPNMFPVSVDLERVMAYSSPQFESVLVGNTLTNALGITGKPFWSVPNAAPLTFTDPEFGYTRSVEHPAGQNTTVLMEFFTTFTVNPRWRPLPSQYYIGACLVEQEVSSGVWVPVTGLQQHQASGGLGGIRINNGLVRCRIASDGSDLALSVDHWKASSQSWNNKQYKVVSVTGGGFTVPVPVAVTIIRNDPEVVVVRSSHRITDDPSIDLYLSVRRGDRWVRGEVGGKDSWAWAVKRSTAEAATSITGGLRATSDDAGGNRYMLASATATTKDTTNGQIALPSAAATLAFGIGSEIGGSTAAAPDQATGTRNMIEQYFAAQAEYMSAIGV